MKLPQPRLIQLPSGLKLVHIHHKGVGAGIFGMTVLAGSADESPDTFGLAHLVEHTIFKGTHKRRSWHIINRMESIGGELNAFTTKEETTVYTIFPSGGAARAIELVADLAINSVFPSAELDKEREVVLDEIASYRDTPSEAVYDDFEDLVFAGTGAGHNILGTPEVVRSLTGDDCRAFLSRYYTKANSVLFYTGPATETHIAALCERHFADLPQGTCNRRTGNIRFTDARERVVIDGLHQSHVVQGIAVDGINGDNRYADALFCNMIGGPGMNSLLNVELRERRGLVYTVEASVARFSDIGLLTVYFGCDPEDCQRCIELARTTCRRLADTPSALLEKRLAKARRQYTGQLAIGSENRENRIMSFARSVLHTSTLPDENLTLQRIEAITADEIKTRAAALSDASYLIFQP